MLKTAFGLSIKTVSHPCWQLWTLIWEVIDPSGSLQPYNITGYLLNRNGTGHQMVYLVICIHSEIAVIGKTEEEHSLNHLSWMQITWENSKVFNPARCNTQQPGCILWLPLHQWWHTPDPTKVHGIAEMPPIMDLQQPQSFLKKFM